MIHGDDFAPHPILEAFARKLGPDGLFFYDAGPNPTAIAGSVVVLIHGNGDEADSWRHVLPALAEQHRVIAPDLPGFGLSTATEDFDYSLEGMAAFVDRFVTELGITEPLNLVVHDIGGPFGLAWVVKHPEKVRSVVVMNTVFHADYRWHLFGRLWRTPVIGEIVQALGV